MLKLGSKGSDVKQLQAKLRELGFDAEGTFGTATHAAVLAFQESRGLLPDGLVGPVTQAALAEGAPEIRVEESADRVDVTRSIRLSSRNYYQEVFPKDLIVLHHTAGASATSTINWWESQPNRIATAYVVERDGTIYEVFDPRHWAHHLGVRGVGHQLDRRSIGIELACEGPVERSGDGYRAFGKSFTGQVFDNASAWRGHRYFAAYTSEQTQAAIRLVRELSRVFGIPTRTPSNHTEFNSGLVSYRGVIGHHHVRSDKTDLHPGFDWPRLISEGALATAD